MISAFEARKSSLSYKSLCAFVAFAFFATMVIFPNTAQAQGVASLPLPGSMVGMTPTFAPPIMKGVQIDPEHPFQFNFIVDTGEEKVSGKALEEEASKLIKYFLAAITVPDEDLWVNLSPYENNRIVPEEFGKTEMGRDLLAQDYILKQFTASLIYPEDDLGKKFWNRVYKKTYEKYGTTDVPVNTFNKVWVVPQKAVVYEHNGTSAFVVERHLKVMLEEDFLALENSSNSDFGARGATEVLSADQQAKSEIASQIVRDILIPEIEKEVNQGKNFANLRQIYNAMILSTWFKRQLRDSVFSDMYTNKNKISGVDIKDKEEARKIYDQYLKAFKKGVCDFVKVEYDQTQNRNIPRKYFSGGFGHVPDVVRIKRSSSILTSGQAGKLTDKAGEIVAIKGNANPVASSDMNVNKENIAGDDAAIVVSHRSKAPDSFTEKELIVFLEKHSLAKDVLVSHRSKSPNPSRASSGMKKEDSKSKIKEVWRDFTSILPDLSSKKGSPIERIRMIAGAFLISIHVALMSAPISLAEGVLLDKWGILQFLYASTETLVSVGMVALAVHTIIAVTKMAQFVSGRKLNALTPELQTRAQAEWDKAKGNIFTKAVYYAKMFFLIPVGKFEGVSRAGLTYKVKAPENNNLLAQAPIAAKFLGRVAIGISIILIPLGLILGNEAVSYASRFFLTLGLVSMAEFGSAEPGEYQKYVERKKRQKESIDKMEKKMAADTENLTWDQKSRKVRDLMKETRPQMFEYNRGKKLIKILVSWFYRNCAMGGDHTIKEYPESNVSFQEAMFIPLSHKTEGENQDMTKELQDTLKQIIDGTEGCRVMGTGLEGGIAAYIELEEGDVVPEQRLWRMMRQAMLVCEFEPWKDVAMAFDPAMNALADNYNVKYNGWTEQDIEKRYLGIDIDKEFVEGKYYFYRHKGDDVVMDSDEIGDLIQDAMENKDIPIVSVEDIMAERDYEGWARYNERFGDIQIIVGDDLNTTRDEAIEFAAVRKLINTFLAKPNQIGTLDETINAFLVATIYLIEYISSHRSKSPNTDLEGLIALAFRALGLKAGGGQNTERLMKYAVISKVINRAIRDAKNQLIEMSKDDKELEADLDSVMDRLKITGIWALEDFTNAGVPTVRTTVALGIPGSQKYSEFILGDGAPSLGTSAGTGEAVHLNDNVVYRDQIPSTEKQLSLFDVQEDGSYRFKKSIDGKKLDQATIDSYGDEALSLLFKNAKRNKGKGGCLNAVANIEAISKDFVGLSLADVGKPINGNDRKLLEKELRMALSRDQVKKRATKKEFIAIMQKKANNGMNAILGQSEAMARVQAANQGIDLWELIQNEFLMRGAKIIAQNNPEKLLTKGQLEKVKEGEAGDEVWEKIYENLTYEEITAGLGLLGKGDGYGKATAIVRKAAGTYDVVINKLVKEGVIEIIEEEAEVNTEVVVDKEDEKKTKKKSSSNLGGISMSSSNLDLQIKRDGAGSPLPMNQQPIMNMNIQGFKFNIMTIQPITTTIPTYLGMSDADLSIAML